MPKPKREKKPSITLQKLSLGSFASWSPEERQKIYQNLTDEAKEHWFFDWKFWARDKQRPPPGDWFVWILRAGRGFGKTRANACWLHDRALEQDGRWMALVARTPADARDYMIEGPGGILRNTPRGYRPLYEPSKRRLTWPNGSWATIYSDEEPDQLRGFSGDTASLDEFAKYRNHRDTWDNLLFGMRERSNDQPRILITTTPRPLTILKEIEKENSSVVVTGSSYENKENLDAKWFSEVLSRYEGTRLGRQEINAEILDDIPGALWTRKMLDGARYKGPTPEFKRVVVGVDPSGTSGNDEGNRVGIVVVGLGVDGLCYVIADRTCSLGPAGWGKRVIESLDTFAADRIVAERNFGGAMVEHVIRTVRPNAPIKMVVASRGKTSRAEPVAALYEQGKVKHLGSVPELEDQQCNFTTDGYQGGDSPDRVDACVWAIHELVLLRQRFETQYETGLPIGGR